MKTKGILTAQAEAMEFNTNATSNKTQRIQAIQKMISQGLPGFSSVFSCEHNKMMLPVCVALSLPSPCWLLGAPGEGLDGEQEIWPWQQPQLALQGHHPGAAAESTQSQNSSTLPCLVTG